MCEALTYLLNNIFIRFGTKLYRQIVGIPLGTNLNCAPLIADLFLLFYGRNFMVALSYNNKEAEIIQAFNSTSKYLLNFDNPYFEDMLGRIYPPELVK